MNKQKNTVELIGFVVSITEKNLTAQGQPIMRWTIESDERLITDKGNEIKVKQTYNLFAHGKLAEFIKAHIEAGQKMAIEGQLISYTHSKPFGGYENLSEIWVKDILLLSKEQ